MSRSLVVSLVGAVLAATLSVAGAPAAQAVQAPQDLVVSADPADFTPHVLDGVVKAIAVAGDVVVLGGDFTRVQDAFGGPVLNRTNIMAFHRTTGAILSFAPVVDATVRTLAPAPDGQSVYVGGEFNKINGLSTFKVGRLQLADGKRVAGFDAGLVDAVVYDLKLVNNRLFIAGQFTAVNGQSRSKLAELDPATGAVRASSWPAFAGTHTGTGVTDIEKIDINPDGATLVAIGNFATVGGLPRVQVAMLDIGATPAVTNWRTAKYEPICATGFKLYVTDVDFAPDGAYFVVSTTGGYGPPPALCDTITRWDADARGPAQAPTWTSYTGGDSNYALAVTGTAVYVGGHERWLNNPNGANAAGPGAVPRQGIAAMDPVNGLPLSWNPSRDRGRGVFDMVATPEGLWVGSDTDRIGAYEYHARIAYFPLAGGTPVPHPVAPPLPLEAYVLGGQSPAARWAFDGDVPGDRSDVVIPGLDPATVTGGFWLDGKLYLALTDGTLTMRSYDGKTAGPVTVLNLYGLTQFGKEVKKMTGLFYTDGGIVFTLSGDVNLYRRPFTPESGVVGAQRTILSNGGVSWTRSRGMFFSAGHLYWSKTAFGDLHRIDFVPAGARLGTDTIVSGPLVDGRDWRATAMFTLPPPASNQSPVAAFSSSCAGNTCSFDAAASTDPDGSVVSYGWDFGDGSEPASGAQVQHSYASPDSYDVTLTVTDDEGASASTTVPVSVVASAVAFVGSAQHQVVGTSQTQTVALPAAVETGDQLVLIMSLNSGSATATDPTGWVRAAENHSTSLTTIVWTKVAADGAAGSTVSVTMSALVKSSLLVSAYRHATVPVGGAVVAAETVSQATHTTPVVTAPDGSWVVSSWADKTSATTTWTPPAAEQVRQTGAGTAGGRVSWLLTDNGGPVAAGPVGGTSATADSATANATMTTVVIAPAG